VFYRDAIQDKYLAAFDNILAAMKVGKSQDTTKKLPAVSNMMCLAHLVEQNWVKPNWVDTINKIAPFYVAHSADIRHIIDGKMPHKGVVREGALNVLIIHLTNGFGEMCTQRDIERL